MHGSRNVAARYAGALCSQAMKDEARLIIVEESSSPSPDITGLYPTVSKGGSEHANTNFQQTFRDGATDNSRTCHAATHDLPRIDTTSNGPPAATLESLIRRNKVHVPAGTSVQQNNHRQNSLSYILSSCRQICGRSTFRQSMS